MNNTTKFFDETQQVANLVCQHAELSTDEAVVLCMRYLENDSIDLNYVLWYCQLMRAAQRSDQIALHAMHWLHRFPDSVLLVHEMAWAWLDLDESFKSERLLRAALKMHAEELMLWCDLASVHINKNQMEAAKECIEYVLVCDPRFAEALRIKARIAIKGGDQVVALDAVNKSLMEDPRNVDGLIMRGIIQDFGGHDQKMKLLNSGSKPWVNALYAVFVIGKNLCGLAGALIWLAFVFVLGWTDRYHRLVDWRHWIIAPESLILIALLGWALMMVSGSLIHHKLRTQEHWPLWKTDWLWTLIPILTWLFFTSIRYSIDEVKWSFAMDFIRSFAFCSIFPIYLWRRLRLDYAIASRMALATCWFILFLFIAGLICGESSLFGVAYYFSAVITLIYICVRGRW